MAYFVTGATGFIGRFLVANLLKRGKPVYVLVRKGSQKKLAEMRDDYGVPRATGHGIVGDPARPTSGLPPTT
jgi:thioester reductase-like protein